MLDGVMYRFNDADFDRQQCDFSAHDVRFNSLKFKMLFDVKKV